MKLAVKLSLSVALSACGAVVLALLSYLGADAIRQSVADVSRTVMPTAAASGHLYCRMARRPLATTSRAVPTSAKTAIHMVA